MNARELMKTVPIGALIAFSDGTPRPPERFTKKLAAWKEKNATGLLVRKECASVLAGGWRGGAGFSLRVGEFGTARTVVMIVNKSFGEESDLDFTVVELPTGMIRLARSGELVPASDLAKRAARGDDPNALQPGETERPAGYGADYPSPVALDMTQVLDVPGVKTYARYGDDLLAVRDDGYYVTFPGTFGRALKEALDTMLDDTARRHLLDLLKRHEDGAALTADDLRAPSRAVTVS